MKTLRNLGLIGILATCLASGCGLKYKTIDSHIGNSNSDITQTQKQEYTFEYFKKALGPKWDNLSKRDKEEIKSEFDTKEISKNCKEALELICVVYTDPINFYNSSSEDEKRGLFPENINLDLFKKYKKKAPWIDAEDPTLADLFLINAIESFSKGIYKR